MADDDGRCGVAVAVVLRAGRQNNQDFSAKITKISAKITKICVRYGRRQGRFLPPSPSPRWTEAPIAFADNSWSTKEDEESTIYVKLAV